MADPVVTPPVTPPPADWTEGLDPEIRGHLQTKGWDKLPPATAAFEAAKAYRELEKFRGIPAEQIARLPKDANDTETWAALNARLGVPLDKAAYAFEGAKDEALIAAMRDAVHAAGLRPDQAAALTVDVEKYLTGTKATADEAIKTQNALAAERLKASWGPNFDVNDAIAGRALAHLNMPADALAQIKASAGVDVTMEALLKLGQQLGEARHIQGQGSTEGGVLSADQAQARLRDLGNDPQWMARWQAGGKAEIAQVEQYSRQIAAARLRLHG